MKERLKIRVSHVQLVDLIIRRNWIPNKTLSELHGELLELTTSMYDDNLSLEEQILEYADYIIINNGAFSSEISSGTDVADVKEFVTELIVHSCLFTILYFQ